jgi:hypothetical protein
VVNIAYIVLAHEPAPQVAAHVELLLEADALAQVIVHYDGNAPADEFAALGAALAAWPRAHLVADRALCGWGQFGLVDGVVRALRLARERELAVDYFYLLSTSCAPIRPLAELRRFLHERRGAEFIEAHSAAWITSGLREERYRLHHWFSFRTHRRLFDLSVRIQRALGIRRREPAGVAMRFGSQWWCLTRETCFAILDFIDRRPRDYRYFRTTWIPDELFFQSMAATLAGGGRVANRNLTYFKFTRKGRPITFYDDHAGVMSQLPFFFARKISPTAAGLRRHLARLAGAPDRGAPAPSLDVTDSPFRYEEQVSRNVEFTRPGQIFFGGQSFAGWPSSLASHSGVFLVLHGPPAITRRVAERIKACLPATLLGRVFHPDKVDLAPLGEAFDGFEADDVHIRDRDRPLYLARLLSRCSGLPILEMVPGDDNDGEWHLHQNRNAVFVPCVPARSADEDWRRLYWVLAAAAFAKRAPVRIADLRTVEGFPQLRALIDRHVERICSASHRLWVNNVLLNDRDRSPYVLPLRWGNGGRMRWQQARDLEARRHRTREEFGPVIEPLLAQLGDIEADLADLPDEALLASLPEPWRALFEPLAAAVAPAGAAHKAAPARLAALPLVKERRS